MLECAQRCVWRKSRPAPTGATVATCTTPAPAAAAQGTTTAACASRGQWGSACIRPPPPWAQAAWQAWAGGRYRDSWTALGFPMGAGLDRACPLSRTFLHGTTAGGEYQQHVASCFGCPAFSHCSQTKLDGQCACAIFNFVVCLQCACYLLCCSKHPGVCNLARPGLCVLYAACREDIARQTALM